MSHGKLIICNIYVFDGRTVLAGKSIDLKEVLTKNLL